MQVRNVRVWFWAIMFLAVVLRIWTFRLYGVHHPDELYQYLEQANRLAFGQGIVPWEYRTGMRSWLPPILFSLPMRVGAAIGPETLMPVLPAKFTAALIGLAPVAAAFALGRRTSTMHGLIAMAVVAVWFESVYFSGHLLTEVLSVAFFLPAAALIRPEANPRTLAAGGALLAFAALLRFHYIPAFSLFALITLGRHWRCWVPLIVGGIAVLALSALIDVIMGQMPFAWIVANFRVNVVESAADRFGVHGPLAYFQMMSLRWGMALPLLVVLPVLVARRYPGLYAAALLNLVLLMAIGHKEYRFIWLTSLIFVLLSAIASADLLQRGIERWRIASRGRSAAMISLFGLWAGGSLMIAESDRLWPNWNRFAARTNAVHYADGLDGLCGVAIHGIDYWSGSHAYLHSSAPLYLPWRKEPEQAVAALHGGALAYNVIVAPEKLGADVPEGYSPQYCYDDGDEAVCVFRRSGDCDPNTAKHELLADVISRHGY